MKAHHVEHIGIAVRNLKESVRLYERILGVACSAIEEVKDQHVTTAIFLVGDTKIELLESTLPEGPIGKHIEKRGEGVHHIALAVDDLGSSLRELASAGVQLIDRDPRPGADGLRIAFLHPRSTGGVLIELCEKTESL